MSMANTLLMVLEAQLCGWSIATPPRKELKMRLLVNLLLVFCLAGCMEMHSQRHTVDHHHQNKVHDLQDLSCFSSSDPAAQKMLQVYDDDGPAGHFWQRNGSLPPCNLTSIISICCSSSPKCEVCTNHSVKPEKVDVLCNKQAARKNLLFEYPNGRLKFNQSDCPRPPAGEETRIRSRRESDGTTERERRSWEWIREQPGSTD